MARRVGRPQAGQEVLSRESILEAALQLVDQFGMEALTMRRLARELNVDPMAIYRHLPDKRTLLSGLVELVFSELQFPALSDGDWQDRVRRFALAYYALARSHPNFVLYLVTDAEAAVEAVLAANEYLYAAIAASGLPIHMLAPAADLVIDFLNGYALGLQSGQLGQLGERAEFFDLLAEQAPGRYPVLQKVYAALTREDVLSNLEQGLTFVIAGIESIAQKANSV